MRRFFRAGVCLVGLGGCVPPEPLDRAAAHDAPAAAASTGTPAADRDAALAKMKADATMKQGTEHGMPGIRHPGSTIYVPVEVEAGSVLVGRAPAGSTVTVAGKQVPLSADGSFRYALPATARGRVLVRILQPGAAAAMELSSNIVTKK